MVKVKATEIRRLIDVIGSMNTGHEPNNFVSRISRQEVRCLLDNVIGQLERASPEMRVKNSSHKIDQLLPMLQAFRRSVGESGVGKMSFSELQAQNPDQALALLIGLDGAIQNGAKI